MHLIENQRSHKTVRLAFAAIDFYLRLIDQPLEKTSLPRRKFALPKVLSKQEIKKIIELTNNPKHKIIIEFLYSSGLRLQELINLKFKHLDFIENMLFVKQGKGRKDRITIVSKKTLDKIKMLGETGHVFRERMSKYSPRLIQEILKQAGKRAGIKQNVTPHMLRHSFATHLLEQGTYIRYMQALLGHSNFRTTQIYTKVAKNKFKDIRSPLD